MGLDMYVAIDGTSDPARVRQMANDAGFQAKWYDDGPDYSLGEPATDPILAYWRKANAVHAWIVRELADGVDECQRIDFPRTKMEELILLCKKVLTEHAATGDLEEAADKHGLQTQSGFFFGSTEYDEYYAADLKDTVDQLSKILSVKGWGEAMFYYRASW